MCLSIMLISKLLPDVVFEGFVVKWHGELKGEICSTVIESVFFFCCCSRASFTRSDK